ncbi:MAG: hypothetical protein CMJ31_05640 [Phycisphaerae bacterium]|nr:hypothetical protein [Phycisphaerae bacterium]
MPAFRRRLLIITSMAIATFGGGASAQSATATSTLADTPPGEPTSEISFQRVHPDDEGWRVRFEPSVGYFGVSGDVGLPAPLTGREDDQRSLSSLDLDSPRLSPYGELLVGYERWSVTVSGLGFSIDGGARAARAGRFGDAVFAAGDEIETEFSYATVGVRGGYRIHRWVSEFEADGTPVVATRADVLFGARGHRVEVDASIDRVVPLPGAVSAASADELFIEPVAGLSLELEYKRTFGLDFYIAAGGLPLDDRSSYSFDLGVGFNYRPRPWIGAQIGYRLIVLGVEEGSGADRFEWDGAIAGLYWGVRFDF